MSSQRAFLACLLSLALGVGLASLPGSIPAASAQGSTHLQVRTAAQTFVEGLSQADAAKVQGACTTQLWARYAPAFQGSPAAGSLGTWELLNSSSPLNRSDYASVLVLCRHPDGVEDAVRITLKQVSGTWKVCGGPGAATTARPF